MSDNSPPALNKNGVSLEYVKGDMDTIVNPASAQWTIGGGMAGAIHRAPIPVSGPIL